MLVVSALLLHPTNEAPLALLERLGYLARDTRTVAAFLDAYPSVVGLLVEAFPHLEHYFEARPPVMLDVIEDDDGRDSRELFALVHTDAASEIALGQHLHFLREWWRDRSPKADGRLNFGLE